MFCSFFGYCTPKYDVVLYTDNIQGEGLGSSSLSSNPFIDFFYNSYSYFGSQLKELTIPGYHYDVREVTLVLSDISAVELKSCDVYAFGIHTAHEEFKDTIPSGEFDGVTIRLADNGEGILMEFDDAQSNHGITMSADFIPLWLWAVYWMLFFLFAFALSIAASFLFDRIPGARPWLCGAASLAGVMVAGCWICGSLPYVDYFDFWLNWLILLAVSLLLNSLTLP